VLKTDASANTILAQTQLGAAGDIGLAMTFDPSGNVYVTGTSTSGLLTATSSAVFPNPIGSSVNSFVAKFDSSLNLNFLTFVAADEPQPPASPPPPTLVFVTGLIYGSGLPVTPAGIIQAPASGSMQNGFVEEVLGVWKDSALRHLPEWRNRRHLSNGHRGRYLRQLPLWLDSLTASGYPTVAALIPRIVGAQGTTTGFLTRLTPAGDGITFSTFIPGPASARLRWTPRQTIFCSPAPSRSDSSLSQMCRCHWPERLPGTAADAARRQLRSLLDRTRAWNPVCRLSGSYQEQPG